MATKEEGVLSVHLFDAKQFYHVPNQCFLPEPASQAAISHAANSHQPPASPATSPSHPCLSAKGGGVLLPWKLPFLGGSRPDWRVRFAIFTPKIAVYQAHLSQKGHHLTIIRIHRTNKLLSGSRQKSYMALLCCYLTSIPTLKF